MKKTSFAVLFAFMVLFVFMSTLQAETPQDTLNQYISDLQKNPSDYALREKIIKHVQTMKPSPPIPEEARRYFIEGNALLKAAKEQKGYGLALDSYRQCLLIAPWWEEAYFNYAVALDLANQFDEAVNALKLYIATNPGEGESRKAQDKIYEIGAKKKLAALESQKSSPQAVPAPKQDTFEDLLRKIDGRRYTQPAGQGLTSVLDVRGRVLIYGGILAPGAFPGRQGYFENSRYEIPGREFTYPVTNPLGCQVCPVADTFIISEDGDRITQRRRYSDSHVNEFIHLWQR